MSPPERDPHHRRGAGGRNGDGGGNGGDNRRGHVMFLVWFAAGAAVLAGIVWLVGQAFGGVSFDQDGPRLVYLLMLVLLLGSGVLLGGRIGLAGAAKAIAIWIAIGILLVAGYAYRAEFTAVWHRITGELSPSGVVGEGPRSFSLRIARDGHFYVDAGVNGTTLRLLVDTGATTTALTPEHARRAGLDPDSLSYTVRVNTASGTAQAAPARIDTLSISGAVLRDVPILVHRAEAGVSVLGMSTLRRFRKVSVEDDRLTVTW